MVDRNIEYPPELIELYRLRRGDLTRLSEAIVGCPALAEDIVHEAFVRLSTSDNASIDSPYRYLFNTVRNLSIDLLRKQKRETKVLELAGDPSSAAKAVASPSNPEIELAWKQNYQIFQDALNDLPTPTRRATFLHAVDQLSTREIAARLNVSVGKAHQLISAGMAHCRNKLLEAGG
ncbi:MAG: RNA polymerase sigma factor [Pseudomonadota bacterium]